MAETSEGSRAILQQIKCAKCWNGLTSLNNYFCRNGHSFCGRCNDDSVRCPQCNAQFFVYGCHNLNEISKILLRHCQHRENGCPEFFKSSDLVNHETACGYRTFKCRVINGFACEWKGIYSKFRNHIEANHSNALQVQSDKFTITWNEGMPEKAIVLIQVFGEYFYLFRQTDYSALLIEWSFQYTGQYAGDAKYRYQMTVFSDLPQIIRPFTFPAEEVNDITVHFELMTLSNCMYTHFDKINRFKAANGDILFDIFVTNI